MQSTVRWRSDHRQMALWSVPISHLLEPLVKQKWVVTARGRQPMKFVVQQPNDIILKEKILHAVVTNHNTHSTAPIRKKFSIILTFLVNMKDNKQTYNKKRYCRHAIIIRGFYTFYPIFAGQKLFLRSFFRKILTLCTVSIQERFQIKCVL